MTNKHIKGKIIMFVMIVLSLYHLLNCGETGSGKSTAIVSLIQRLAGQCGFVVADHDGSTVEGIERSAAGKTDIIIDDLNRGDKVLPFDFLPEPVGEGLERTISVQRNIDQARTCIASAGHGGSFADKPQLHFGVTRLLSAWDGAEESFRRENPVAWLMHLLRPGTREFYYFLDVLDEKTRDDWLPLIKLHPATFMKEWGSVLRVAERTIGCPTIIARSQGGFDMKEAINNGSIVATIKGDAESYRFLATARNIEAWQIMYTTEMDKECVLVAEEAISTGLMNMYMSSVLNMGRKHGCWLWVLMQYLPKLNEEQQNYIQAMIQNSTIWLFKSTSKEMLEFSADMLLSKLDADKVKRRDDTTGTVGHRENTTYQHDQLGIKGRTVGGLVPIIGKTGERVTNYSLDEQRLMIMQAISKKKPGDITIVMNGEVMEYNVALPKGSTAWQNVNNHRVRLSRQSGNARLVSPLLTLPEIPNNKTGKKETNSSRSGAKSTRRPRNKFKGLSKKRTRKQE